MATALLLLCGNACADGSVECCSSVAPEFPPATAYGANMYRPEDPRSEYQPRRPLRMDAPASVDELLNRIERSEAHLGPFAPALLDPFAGLGAAYLATEDYANASTSYARAIHLLRLNEGLRSPTQAPLVEQLIEARLGAGDFLQADAQQSYLFTIRKSSLEPSDPQMLEAVLQYADWLRAAYLAELDEDRYPRLLELFDLHSDMIEATAREEHAPPRAQLPYLYGKHQAQYLMSIYPGETEEGLQVDVRPREQIDLPDLKKLRFMKLRDFNYRYGQETIRAIQAALDHDPVTTLAERADAIVLLGDWYQWHRRPAQALREYRKAWELMAHEADGEQWLHSTFSEPLELPPQVVFQPGRLPLKVSTAAAVVVRFDVSRLGSTERIDVLSPDGGETQSAAIRGHKFLREMRFRPSFSDGQAVAARGIERIYSLRY